MNPCICPSAVELESYVSGKLDETTHGQIDAHIDACATCQNTVDTLDDMAGTALPVLRQSSAHSAATIDPDLVRLVSLAKAIGRPTSDARPPTEPHAGLVLGNYTLLEPIGAGGMGRVFKAYHRRMKRVVALKLLAPELLRSEAARLRFQREVEAAARLTHPNIVAAHDADEAEGRHFLVMEYVEGRTLADVVKQEGPLPWQRVLNFVQQAARGLEHAHAAGIVHRDIKPANLLLTGQETVKVLDMGLARVAEPELDTKDRELTTTGVVMGTAAFMAPEQAVDTREADHRADIYSLGCTLYYLATGKPPYDGQTPLAILLGHREKPLPMLGAARNDCPPALERIFHTMIAKRPEDRYQSMRVVRAEIDRLLAHSDPRLFHEHASSTLVARPRTRGRRWLIAALGGLAAGLLLAAALLGSLSNNAMPQAGPTTGGTGPLAITTPRSPAIDMVTISAGQFLMGSPDNDKNVPGDERPQHLVSISRPFQMGRTKVTQAQFQEVMEVNPSAFASSGRSRHKVTGLDTSQFPVESIRWLDAVTFCNRLSERHGLTPYYVIDGPLIRVRGGTGFRLPTEAEWEYACRAGTTTRWSFGDDPKEMDRFAWHSGNSAGRTHPVGKKLANPWGLLDMHGTVPEWCWDRYDETYYKTSPDTDPPGSGKGSTRVHRGGSWNLPAEQSRSATRHALEATYGMLNLVGMRVARDTEP
ncbi:MAG: SUMF1/EgtB/PvdO family nonheme iron enzyme [Gemmataceae bacterium]|nr:SUMF1/EgtB/PvdO family nonheme iron enzyme [Gemmataceae bacterium]